MPASINYKSTSSYPVHPVQVHLPLASPAALAPRPPPLQLGHYFLGSKSPARIPPAAFSALPAPPALHQLLAPPVHLFAPPPACDCSEEEQRPEALPLPHVTHPLPRKVRLLPCPRHACRNPPRPRPPQIRLRLEIPLPPLPPPPPSPRPNPLRPPNPPNPPKKAKIPKRVPPPLATELALMQFTDGGSLEKHAQRVMSARAAAAGPGVGVGAVWRDGEGGVWWDEEERWDSGAREKENAEDLERRGSVSTQDSDLDARYLVQPASHEDILIDFVPLPALPRPHAHAMSRKVLLALPARPRRAAKHLNKPELVDDLAAFGAAPAAFSVPASPTASSKPSKGSRRRPAPLKLARPHHAAHAANGPRTAPAPSTGDVRRDFLAASFAPAVPMPTSASALPVPAVPMSPLSPMPSTRARRLSVTSTATAGAGKAKGLRGLFRRRD
ncbi:hypothetical protein MSAN_00737300 [Mycena sanguinolenta]|uniref:Uncharacterized protein n=1 Tax=Mycena sanguinolenta TaxID=230812 RepID=A0A8H6Z744_9AGAR|nr:hypothetical protein MSAN_00737300 [Mycena sanguinolenta]